MCHVCAIFATVIFDLTFTQLVLTLVACEVSNAIQTEVLGEY